MRGHGRRWTMSRALGSAVIAVCLVAAGASMVPVAAFVTGSLPNGFGAIVVDPSHSHVFVSSPTSNTITVLDFSGKIVQTVTGEAGPDSMVVTGNTLYVTLRNGGAIDVFDTSTLLRTGTLGAGRLVQPGPLVLAAGKLWTSTGPCGQSSVQLASVDPTTDVVQTWNMPTSSSLGYCIGLAGSPATPGILLGWDVGLSPATISKIDVSTGSPQVLLSVWEGDQGNLKQIAINPSGASFVTASGAPYQLDEFRLTDLSLDGIVYPTGPYPVAVATSAARGGFIAGGLYAPYDPDIHTFRPGVPGADVFTTDFGSTSNVLYDHGLAFSPDGSVLFAVTGDVYGSQSALFNVIPLANTTRTAITASASAVAPGAPVTFTATVSVAGGGFATPTGTVTFSDNGVKLATVALGNAQATFTTSWTAPSTHSIGAHYDGDINNQASGQDTRVSVGNLTTTAIVSSVNPSAVGQSVTFTATVNATTAATGTVTFNYGAPALTVVPLVNSQASFTTSSLPAGTTWIYAAYSGDSTNTPSNSPTIAQTVGSTSNQTFTSLKPSANPVQYGQPLTLTANVTGGTSPSGSVTFYDNNAVTAPLAKVQLLNGFAEFTTSLLTVGTHSLSASYNGDSVNQQSWSATLSESVTATSPPSPVPTSLALASSMNPVIVSQPVTFTASIVNGAATVTGTVTFSEVGAVLATVPVSGRQASLTTSSLAVGTHTITATYNGDSANQKSAPVSVTETVSKAASTTAVSSSRNPAKKRISVTFTAKVVATPNISVPTGTVTFYVGAPSSLTVLATRTLSAGTASFSTSTLAVGSDVITVVYGGDASVGSSSGQVTETITKN